ncbi:replication associated protein [Chicken virus mg6_2056]|nr:replication associated protein [Chicken virus mg6_2056]
MATEEWQRNATGNTKSRSVQITLNEVDRYDELMANLETYKSLDYFISCEEVAPTTGHKHIHIYAHFKNPIRLSYKKMCGAHVENCRGSPQQNIAYIEKDGNILEEWGKRPNQGVKNIGDLMECSSEEVPANLKNIYDKEKEKRNAENNFKNMLEEIKNDNLKGPKVIYITGDSGSGKTYKAYKLATEQYNTDEIGKITFNNGFADIVNKEAKCFVIEEFRPSDIKGSKLLEFLDKYGCSLNTKGGFAYVRPEMIIIASIFHPKRLYNSEENNKQFIRRISELIELQKENKEETDWDTWEE